MKKDPTKSPLWAVRLLPWSPRQTNFITNTSGPDERPKFPNVYHFVFASYHAINDGYSNAIMNKVFLEMIGSILNDNPVDDSLPLGTLICPEKEFEEQEKMEKAFLDNPVLLQERKEFFGSIVSPTLLNTDFIPPLGKPKTVVLIHVFNEEVTKAFKERSKRENISFHSGLCTLIDAAIVKTLVEAGQKLTSYRISSSNAVDMRKIFPKSEVQMGLGQRPLFLVRDVAESVVKENFWSEAKKHFLKFRSEYQRKASLEREVVSRLTGTDVFEPHKDVLPCENKAYYLISNTGESFPIQGNYGPYLHLEYMDGTTDMTATNYLWMVLSFIFRGKLYCSFQYNTNMIDADTAEKVKQNMIEIMPEIV